MNDLLFRSWWMLVLRGTVALLFGALALLWPGLSFAVLLGLFAAYALVGGVAFVAGAVRHRKTHEDWWLPLLLGAFGIAAGIIAIAHPALTLLVLVLLIAANALVSGVLDIAMAVRLPATRHQWMLILSGAVSVLFGALVFLLPDLGALAIAWMISIYAIISGALLLALGLRLRLHGERRSAHERRSGPDRRTRFAH